MEKIERKLNEYMEQEIAAKKHQSLTLGVFSHGFTGFYNFGSQNGMAVTENGFFEIASVSKIFTSILVLKLIKKGKINLDSYVEEYLPQFKVKNKVTVEGLLSHTSGLPREPQSFTSIAPKNSFVGYTKELFLKDISVVELVNENIGVFNYSNYGYIILGQIIEAIEKGVDFKELLIKEVVKPLNLSQTKFDLSETEKIQLCKGHCPELEEVEPYLDLGPMYSSAGALVTTTKEMLDFCKILTGEVRIDSEMNEVISEVTKVRVDSNGNKYSLGLHVRETEKEVYLYHPGNIAGHKCSVIISTTFNKALVYNTDTLHHVKIVWDLIDTYLGATHLIR